MSCPRALGYWCVVSADSLVPLVLISLYVWHPLGAAAAPFAMGIGCAANWTRNRAYHCAFTAPIFILAGVALLLIAVGLIGISPGIVWALAIAGTIVALFLESRCARRIAEG